MTDKHQADPARVQSAESAPPIGSATPSSSSPPPAAPARETLNLRAALSDICNDAVGEFKDPLWIVQRDLILAGMAALAASPPAQVPDDTRTTI